jgi:hypothetical protein
MAPEEFERLVSAAYDLIPDQFRSRMENIAVIVEPEPGAHQLARSRVARGSTLFGLYEGRPLTVRSVFDSFAMPDRIIIFRVRTNALHAARNTSRNWWKTQSGTRWLTILEWMKRRSVQRSAPATVSNKRVDEFCPLQSAWKWTVTVTTAFCGTVQYPNPERMTRHPEVNRATSG